MRWFYLILALGCALGAVAGNVELRIAPSGWRFENGPEFPGAAGSLTFDGGHGTLTGNFSGGGDYVMAAVAGTRTFPEAEALEMEVKPPARRLSLRMQDQTGQFHQIGVDLPPGASDAWRKVRFPLAASGLAWGGAKDRKFHGPIRQFGLILRKVTLPAPDGSCEFRNLTFIGTAPGAKLPVGGKVHDLESLYPAAGEEQPLVITLDVIPSALSDAELCCRFRDYTGAVVKEETARFDPKAGTLTVTPPTATGHYDWEFPWLQLRGGIAVSPAFAGAADEYWGMDTSLSRKNHLGGETLRALLRILRRNGIGWGRDRFTYAEVHPADGRVDFSARNGRYELFRTIAAEEGVSLLDVFHDTPAWNKQLNRPADDFLLSMENHEGYSYGSNVYPRNLLAAADGWSRICRHWPAIRALEVWNEPDIGFGNQFPLEFVTAFTKAVSSRFAQDQVAATVVGGVFAIPRENTPYLANAIAGGLFDDIDVFSFHTYAAVPVLEEQLLKLRQWENSTKNDRRGLPYWVTESGKPWPRGTTRARGDDDRASAAEVVGKAIEFKALGVARHFAFCYPYYDENQSNFALIDADGTPMRSMSAYGFAARLLHGKQYAGDLRGTDATRARIFTDADGDAVIWLYRPLTPATAMAPVTLPPEVVPRELLGLDGRKLALINGKVPMSDGSAYLRLPFASLPAEAIDAGTPAMKLTQIARSWSPKPRAAKPVVFQPDYDLTGLIYETAGYRIESQKPFPVEFWINNVSGREQTVEPELSLPPGVSAAGFSGAPLTVPANSRVRLAFVLTGSDSLNAGEFSLVELRDRRHNATPLVIPLRRFAPEAVLADHRWISLDPQRCWTNWQGHTTRSDIAARFRLLREPGALVLEIEVDDETHHCNYPADAAWRGDSVQFALQARNRGRAVGPAQEYCASSGGDGTGVYRHQPRNHRGKAEEIRFDFQRQKGRSRYLLRIPDGEFAAGAAEVTEIGFSLVVNSNSGSGRNGYLSWGDGIADTKTPLLFNKVLFPARP